MRKALANMLDGRLNFSVSRRSQKIDVKADKVACRASNVDISAHSCGLHVRQQERASFNGHAAHELYATSCRVRGVPSVSAQRGGLFESLTALSCADELQSAR